MLGYTTNLSALTKGSFSSIRISGVACRGLHVNIRMSFCAESVMLLCEVDNFSLYIQLTVDNYSGLVLYL